MSFEKEFPNFKGAIWSIEELCDWDFVKEEDKKIDSEDCCWVSTNFVQDCCLDKERVKKAIKKVYEKHWDDRQIPSAHVGGFIIELEKELGL